MAYIGNTPSNTFTSLETQTITGDNSTEYTLTHAVSSGKDILVYINNVKQEEGSGKSYTATGNTITFSDAVASGDSCYLLYINRAISTHTPADASVDADAIAGSAVTTAKINADAITGAKIADDAIDSEHYTDGSIDTAHLGNLQVTTAKIAADAITGAKIADDAIDSEHYTDGSIDTAHLANNSVGITQLNVSDGSNGQFMKTDGSGTLSFATVDTSSATDSFTISGTTPTLTIGDAGAEDTKIVFDGNAQDFHIGLDDSADSLTIGLGSTLGTTSHMVFDANGIITKPLQPAFLVQPASAQNNLPINAVTDIVFGTERFDQNGDFASNTFTAPVTGRYQLNTTIYVQNMDAANNYFDILISTSKRNYFHTIDPESYEAGGADAPYYSATIAVLADMDANDTAKVQIGIPNNGTAQCDVQTGSTFSGFLAC